jgi:PKD repeat protein
MKTRVTHPLSLISLFVLFVSLFAFFATPYNFAKADTDRAFVPAQRGLTKGGESVPSYAPDRILVKFTPEGLVNSNLNIRMQKGASAPSTSIGISSIDAVFQSAGVTRIERPYDSPRKQILVQQIGVDRWFTLHLNAGSDLLAIVQRLSSDPNIESVTPDYRVFPAAVPNDPLYPDQWGHNNTGQMLSYDWSTHSHENGDPVGTPGFDSNAEIAWGYSQGYGSTGVIIGITDSGVDIDHPDLRLVTGYDFGDNDNNPDDDSADPGHGTACAGVASSMANNSLGGAGIGGGCSIMPLKIANSQGAMYLSTLQSALYYAADNGAHIVSMSIGAPISSDPPTDDAILYAYNAGVTMLAATGNANHSPIDYPAINSYVIGVGAASPCGERKRSSSNPLECNPGVSTDPNGYTCDGERWWGSNWGVDVQDAAGAVDLIAPTIMPTTDIGGGGGYASGDYYMWFNGTSCSTPYAAGVCGLIISAFPGSTPADVREKLLTNAQDIISVESGAGWDKYTGYGMVDAAAAVFGNELPPVAEFYGDPTSGNAPLQVQFYDQSTNNPTSWSWDFGDGIGTSTDRNPIYTYDNIGTYTVSLTATNAYGSDDEIKVGYISVTDGGNIALALSDIPVSGTVNGTYVDTHVSDDVYEVITELETGGNPKNRRSYLEHKWDFNVTAGSWVNFYVEAYRPVNTDGDDFSFEYSTDNVTYTPVVTVNSATEQVYSAPLPSSLSGTVYIRVVDTDNTRGNRNKDSVYIDHMYIESGVSQEPPVADFVGDPTLGDAPLDVQFTDLSLNGPTSWDWDFGDGGTSTEQHPLYAYQTPGTYTVTLIATNGYGSDTETKSNYITVTEGGTTVMHVSSVVVTRKQAGPNNNGIATVTIVDQTETPVANATVYGYFNEPNENPKSGVTGADGVAVINGDKTKDPVADFCFTVTDVALSGATYDPFANDVTTACESTPASMDPEVSSRAENDTPPTYNLLPNHPNPFHSTTNIAFELPTSSHVTLEVYNIRGQRVEVLVDRTVGPGVHSVVWNVSKRPSGVYYCRMKAGTFVQTQKMIVLR